MKLSPISDTKSHSWRAFPFHSHSSWFLTPCSELIHPNLVTLVGILQQPQMAMVLEWCSGPDLHALLYRFAEKGLALHDMQAVVTPALQLRLLLDIARGLTYLHACDPPIAHRDLRSPNIFVRFIVCLS